MSKNPRLLSGHAAGFINVLALAITLLGAGPMHAAQTGKFSPGAVIKAKTLELLDISFLGPAELAAPFEVDASATIEGPGDARLVVPLFFNSGREFILRFTPPTAGEWKFNTTSQLKELDGLSGIIASAPARDGRHGEIGISKSNPQAFAYSDGTPYFPITFECDWLFALDVKNLDGIPKTRSLMNYIEKNGFNQVVMNVYAYDVVWPKDPKLKPEFDYGRPGYSPFGTTNESPDFSTLNLSLFQHLDRVFADLDDRNLAAHLMIYVWNKGVNWPEAKSEADNRYFDYVVKRYQAYPNVIWDISKEALGYGHSDPGYITDRITRLRKLDAFKHLVTVHDYGYCDKFPDQVDFISIQTWLMDLYSEMRKVVTWHPAKPVLNIEHGGYERGPYHVFTGDYLDADVCLERAYQCVFAGSFPSYYWQDTSWSVVIHDPASLSPEEQPEAVYYKHLAELMNRYDLATLKFGSRDFSHLPTITAGKDSALIYIPKELSAIGGKLPAHIHSGTHASWFNPRTGEFKLIGPIKSKNGQSLIPPAWGGFLILVIEPDSKS